MSRNNRKLIIALPALIIASVILAVFFYFRTADSPSEQTADSRQNKTPQTTKPAFDKNRFSIEAPASLWVVINKQRPLPDGYAPGDMTNINGVSLRAEAAAAAKELMTAAENEGVKLKIISAFRSYATQKNVYNNYVQKDGQAAADTYSARSGHSEHQTGLAADLGNSDGTCDLETCFADTAGGRWLAEHAHHYGFIIRYESDKTDITGYQYEPWHIRYVGRDLARELHDKKQTMEEFFGLPAALSY